MEKISGPYPLSQTVFIDSPNLDGRVPPRSSADFSFGFYITSPDFNFTTGAREAFARKLEQAVPGLSCSPYDSWGNNCDYVFVRTDTKNHPGLCRHLVNIMLEAGVDVRTMHSWRYKSHQLFDSIQPLANPPDCIKDIPSFQRFVLASIKPEPVAVAKPAQAYRP